MRRGRAILAATALAAAIFSTFSASAHTQNGAGCFEDPDNPVKHRHTASGSCKDVDNWKIECATTGNVGPEFQGVRFFANQTANGAEVEGCSEGDAATRGRLVGVVDTNNGVKVAFDSDSSNPNGGGGAYINGQVNRNDPTKSGLYCSADEGEPSSTGDGYARSWSNPGPEGGLNPNDSNFPEEGTPAECKPGFIPIP